MRSKSYEQMKIIEQCTKYRQYGVWRLMCTFCLMRCVMMSDDVCRLRLTLTSLGEMDSSGVVWFIEMKCRRYSHAFGPVAEGRGRRVRR